MLATQTLPQARPRWMAVTVDGDLPAGVTAKDVILAIIGRIGTGGGIGHVIEYRGSAIRALSMEGRMTVCNMSIEAGARAGLVAPDDTTFAYLEGRRHAPEGQAVGAGARRLAHAAHRRRRGVRQARSSSTPPTLRPHVSWGTNPGQVASIDGARARPRRLRRRRRARGGRPGARLHGPHGRHRRSATIAVDTVFIGSCTNSRIEDLRAAAAVARRPPRQRRRGPWSCPARHAVKAQAEAEGLDRVFTAAGFDWREPGCSMCLAMNPDKLAPGERCASTSQPQLRGPPGPGRPHPPRVARRGRRHRRRRPLRHPRRTSS